MKAFYNIFQKYIYSVALIAIVLTVHTMYDYEKTEAVVDKDTDIQSFIIRTLDNSLYIQSTDKIYCRFLYKYSSSFTADAEISEDEIMVDKYNGILEFTTVNGEEYSVYIQLDEPVNNTSDNLVAGLFYYGTPTLVSVNSATNKNMYIYNSYYSEGLREVILKLKNS